MDLFRDMFHSVFRGNKTDNRIPESSQPDELWGEDEDHTCPHHSCDQHGHGEDRFFDHPSFPPSFEEMKRQMDNTFDEMFKMFGVDSMPMFDPYIPEGFSRSTRDSSTELPTSANVRDRMLRGPEDRVNEDDDGEINVRSRMLQKEPGSFHQPSNRSSQSKQADVNWDSLLKEGGNVHDILDGKIRDNRISPVQPHASTEDAPPQVKSFFRYSSVTSTRKPDGTIETRRVTRDASGNKKETVEITDGSS